MIDPFVAPARHTLLIKIWMVAGTPIAIAAMWETIPPAQNAYFAGDTFARSLSAQFLITTMPESCAPERTISSFPSAATS